MGSPPTEMYQAAAMIFSPNGVYFAVPFGGSTIVRLCPQTERSAGRAGIGWAAPEFNDRL